MIGPTILRISLSMISLLVNLIKKFIISIASSITSVDPYAMHLTKMLILFLAVFLSSQITFVFLLLALFSRETTICFKYSAVFDYLGLEIINSKISWTFWLISNYLTKISGANSLINVSSYSRAFNSELCKKKMMIPSNFANIFWLVWSFTSLESFLIWLFNIVTNWVLNLGLSLSETCSKQ